MVYGNYNEEDQVVETGPSAFRGQRPVTQLQDKSNADMYQGPGTYQRYKNPLNPPTSTPSYQQPTAPDTRTTFGGPRTSAYSGPNPNPTSFSSGIGTSSMARIGASTQPPNTYSPTAQLEQLRGMRSNQSFTDPLSTGTGAGMQEPTQFGQGYAANDYSPMAQLSRLRDMAAPRGVPQPQPGQYSMAQASDFSGGMQDLASMLQPILNSMRPKDPNARQKALSAAGYRNYNNLSAAQRGYVDEEENRINSMYGGQ